MAAGRQPAQFERSRRECPSRISSADGLALSGQNECEGRTDTYGALNHDVSAHGAREVATDGQPQPDAVTRLIQPPVGLNEWLENFLQALLGNTGAGITDLHVNAAVDCLARKRDPAATIRVSGIFRSSDMPLT